MSYGYECLALVGAGGHASVVFEAIKDFNDKLKVQVYSINNKNRIFEETSLFKNVRFYEKIQEIEQKKFHVAIGDNLIRESCSKSLINLGCAGVTVIHPSALVSRSACIKGGVFVAGKAVVSANTFLGSGVIINHLAIIDHDVKVQNYSHIAPGAILGGGVSIGRRCLVGAGAIILPRVVIEDDAIIGAGAVVTKKVYEKEVVMGVPARSNLEVI